MEKINMKPKIIQRTNNLKIHKVISNNKIKNKNYFLKIREITLERIGGKNGEDGSKIKENPSEEKCLICFLRIVQKMSSSSIQT